MGLTLSMERAMRMTECYWFSVILLGTLSVRTSWLWCHNTVIDQHSKSQVKAKCFMSVWCRMGQNDSWEDVNDTASWAMSWNTSHRFSSWMCSLYSKYKWAEEPWPCIGNLWAVPMSKWWPPWLPSTPSQKRKDSKGNCKSYSSPGPVLYSVLGPS